MLKGIVMFYKDDAQDNVDSTDVVSAPMNNEEKVPLIDMNASDHKFGIDIERECTRKRIRTLQQIELKKVDNLEGKGLQEFMHTSGCHDDPIENAFSTGNTDSVASGNKEQKGSIRGWVAPIRDASRSVKSVISGAIQDFKSHQEESMTTINEEV